MKRLSLLSSLSGSLMFGEEAVNGAAAADKVDNVVVEEVAGTTVFAVVPADFGGLPGVEVRSITSDGAGRGE